MSIFKLFKRKHKQVIDQLEPLKPDESKKIVDDISITAVKYIDFSTLEDLPEGSLSEQSLKKIKLRCFYYDTFMSLNFNYNTEYFMKDICFELQELKTIKARKEKSIEWISSYSYKQCLSQKVNLINAIDDELFVEKIFTFKQIIESLSNLDLCLEFIKTNDEVYQMLLNKELRKRYNLSFIKKVTSIEEFKNNTFDYSPAFKEIYEEALLMVRPYNLIEEKMSRHPIFRYKKQASFLTI